MPPKNLFTKEEIITAAVDVVRREGAAALTARSLAQELGTSTKPIFGLFENMEEVKIEVIHAADRIYQQLTVQILENQEYPAYKSTGMAYIQMAKEEKELFKLLFMRDRSSEPKLDDYQQLKPVLKVIQKQLHIGEFTAYCFHLEMWCFVHGIATMIATGYVDWDMHFISTAMTDMYLGLKSRLKEETE